MVVKSEKRRENHDHLIPSRFHPIYTLRSDQNQIFSCSQSMHY